MSVNHVQWPVEQVHAQPLKLGVWSCAWSSVQTPPMQTQMNAKHVMLLERPRVSVKCWIAQRVATHSVMVLRMLPVQSVPPVLRLLLLRSVGVRSLHVLAPV